MDWPDLFAGAEFPKAWSCGHPPDRRTLDDGRGYAICGACGGATVVYVTRETLDEAFKAVRGDAT